VHGNAEVFFYHIKSDTNYAKFCGALIFLRTTVPAKFHNMFQNLAAQCRICRQCKVVDPSSVVMSSRTNLQVLVLGPEVTVLVLKPQINISLSRWYHLQDVLSKLHIHVHRDLTTLHNTFLYYHLCYPHYANDAKTFLKHFSDCLFYFCSTCADSINSNITQYNRC